MKNRSMYAMTAVGLLLIAAGVLDAGPMRWVALALAAAIALTVAIRALRRQ